MCCEAIPPLDFVQRPRHSLRDHNREIRMNKFFYTFSLLVGFLVAACENSPQPDVLAMLMPAPASFEVQKIEHKSVLVPDDRGLGAQSEQDMQVLNAQGISSSAYFKYWREAGQAYKVRINVYTDPQACERGWDKRFPADTLSASRSLGLGDESFYSEPRMAAFRIGPTLVEMTSSKGAPRLDEFARAYAAHVIAQYR